MTESEAGQPNGRGAAQGELTRVSFVLLPRFNMMTLTMLMEPMRIANYLAPQKLYEWDFRASFEGPVSASSGMTVACRSFDQEGLPVPDMIVVCGSWGAEHLDDQRLFRWLRRLARSKVQMVAVELGIYAFAKAGIVTDQKVTTHWSMMAGLAEAYPELQVVEQLFSVEGPVMTCSGGTAGLDLMLHIVGRKNGDQLAAEIANQVMHHPRRPPEALQRYATGGKHDDVHQDVRAAMTLLEARIEEPTPVPRVCREIGVSQRKLERLFKRDIGCTIVQYSKLLRLQYARVLLSSTRMSIREVSAACGFNSMSYFSQSFLEAFGKKPSEYRQAWPEKDAAPSWPGTVYSFLQGTGRKPRRKG
ncbi:GlxA family transcriptional regulator [Aestuariivirga sp.]|uniref:GlxA family transcriptional regulator n=1 Tax=Aestuariivirga sp. TaxID=2650926 RepID=UPI0039189AD8